MRPRPIPRKTQLDRLTGLGAVSPGFNEAAADTAENAALPKDVDLNAFASMRPRPIPRKTGVGGAVHPGGEGLQ